VGILKRSMMTVAAIGAAGAIAAGGSIPALAATTSGVRYQEVQSTSVLGPNGTQCGAIVLSAAVSTGEPAYVSAMVKNTLTNACTGWLQSSVNGGAWTDVSPKQSVPGGQGLNNEAWYKTADYYAGPGARIRACVQQASGTAARCSGPVSLAESTATPASDATSVYYAHKQQAANASSGSGLCFAYLNSSTKSKASTSRVNMILGGISPLTCTGWLESSTDNGKTWEQATPTYSLLANIESEFAFSSAVADGTGQLIRACVQATVAKVCTAAW
jgi:hypothetical protein